MRSEYVLWWFSLACAVFLMFAPFTPRTMWYYNGSSPVGNAYSYRDAAGWDALSLPCGVAALISLVVGAFLRPCVIVPVLTAAGAAAAFGLTAFAAGQYWIDLARGAAAIPDYRIDPA